MAFQSEGNYETAQKWQKLLAQRQDFIANNIETCNHHGFAVSVNYTTMFYYAKVK